MLKNRISSLLLVLLLGWTTLVSAQEALNYGFVSPNTQTDLKLEEAIKRMNSPEETKLIKQTINLGCVVRSRIRAFRALGSWSDGAEHSVMLRVKSDEASVRYVLSRIGRDARQKAVLYFHPRAGGTAILFKLQPRQPARNLVALSNVLERSGITFRTLVPVNGNTFIYVVDVDGDLRTKVMAAARRLRARVTAETGNAAFVNSEAYEPEIKEFESKNPNLPPPCETGVRQDFRMFQDLHEKNPVSILFNPAILSKVLPLRYVQGVRQDFRIFRIYMKKILSQSCLIL